MYRLFLLFLTLVPIACSSGGGESAPTGIVRHLELRAKEAGEASRPRLVKTLDAAQAEEQGWSARPVELAIREVGVPSGEKRVGALVEADSEVQISIPIDLELASFNEVTLTYASRENENVFLRVLGEGKFLGATPAQMVARSLSPVPVNFDMAENRGNRQRADELVVVFHAGNDQKVQAGVFEVALNFVPPASRLPGSETSDMVAIGSQSRRAVGISVGQTLTTEFGVTKGERLQFSYGQPDAVRITSGEADSTLAVELVGDGGARLERDLILSGAESSWGTADIDLGALAGQRVTASFRLVAAQGDAACALGTPRVVRSAANAPLVVLISSDTHRADHVGAADMGVEVATPHLDALSARGVRFVDCFTATNVTNPSHVALLTALHPRDHGVLDNRTPLQDRATTLAEVFRDAGYVTYASISADHLDHFQSGLGQGFQRMARPDWVEQRAENTVRTLMSWLDETPGQATFVWLHLFDAHTPYAPPQPFKAQYYDGGDPNDPNKELGIDERLLPYYMQGLRDLEFPEAQYRGEVSYLDDVLGKLFARADMQRATIAFTADHGESFGGHGVWWNHGGLYPDNIHVPLILAGPEVESGQVIDAPVRQIDVGRTLLDLAGLSAWEFPGRNVLVVEGQGGARFGLGVMANAASLTEDGWHIVVNLRDHVVDHHGIYPTRERHATELYYLPDDPECENDLLEVEFERARALRGRLVEWVEAASKDRLAGVASDDPETLEKLAKIGYVLTDSEPVEYDLDRRCDCAACTKFR